MSKYVDGFMPAARGRIPRKADTFQPFNSNSKPMDIKSFDRQSDLMKKFCEPVLGEYIGSNVYAAVTDAAMNALGKNGVNFFTQLVPLLKTFQSSYQPQSVLKSKAEVIDVHNYYYTLVLNIPTAIREFQKLPSFMHIEVKEIDSTKKDAVELGQRISQVTKCGCNEKVLDILDHKSYISFKDLEGLIESHKNVEDAIEKQNKKIDDLAASSINSKVPKIKNKFQKNIHTKNIGNQILRCYIRSTTTKLRISNDAIAYNCFVNVYVCQFNMFANSNGEYQALSVAELYQRFVSEAQELGVSSIKPAEILQHDKPEDMAKKEWPFKHTLILAPEAQIFKSQVFNDHVKIHQSMYFSLKPSEIANVNVLYNYTNAIDLYQFKRYVKNDSPINVFFMVQAVGSSNGRVTDKQNYDNKIDCIAPAHIRYAVTNSIEYIARNEEPDQPLIKTIDEPSKEFESGTLQEHFYPTREANYNIPLADLDINGRNPKGRYMLDLDVRTTNESNLLSAMVATARNDIFPEQAEGILKEFGDGLNNNTTEIPDMGDSDD